MVLPRVFVLLSITMCLVAYLCAQASVTQVEAQRKVTDLQEQTMKTLQKAQRKYTEAERVRKNVESRMEKVKKAASESEAAAKGNEEAKGFAEKAKIEMQECLTLYPDAKDKAAAAVPVMQNLKTEAAQVHNEAESKVAPDTGSSDDYAQVIESVKTVEAKRIALEEKLKTQEQLLDAADAALSQLSDHANRAEVAKDQVKAIVAVAKMETLLNEADANIFIIKQKRDKVDATVKKIGEIFQKAPDDLKSQIFGINNNADGDLSAISRSVREVQGYKNAMLEHKQTADGFLANIKTETEQSNVRDFLRGIMSEAEQAAGSLEKIRSALNVADAHVRNANSRQQEMLDVLSAKTSKTTSKETTVPNNNEPTGIAEGTMTKPTSEDTTEEKETKTGQYATKRANSTGTKGTVSPYGAKNDGAITVSFSLLLALIVCVALN